MPIRDESSITDLEVECFLMNLLVHVVDHPLMLIRLKGTMSAFESRNVWLLCSLRPKTELALLDTVTVLMISVTRVVITGTHGIFNLR